MKALMITFFLLSSLSSYASTMTDDQKIKIIKQIITRDLPTVGLDHFKIKTIDLDLPYRYAIPLIGQAAAVVDHISFADDIDVDIANIELTSGEAQYLLTCKAVSSKSEIEDHEEDNLYSYSMALRKCKLINFENQTLKKLGKNLIKKWDQHF